MQHYWSPETLSMLHMPVLQWIVIHICIGSTVSQTAVRGVVGQAVTLPCTYNVRNSRELHPMCWGRGSCPNSKCSNEILHTDGRQVTSQSSFRYSLRGPVVSGDVSLTIRNLNERDRGLYCCRIEIPGWFNDLKKTLNLQVDRATTTVPTTTITTKSHVTTTTTMAPLTFMDTHSETSPVPRTDPAPPSPTGPAPPPTSTGTSVPTMAPSSVATSVTLLIAASSLANMSPSPTTLPDETTNYSCSSFTTETYTPITAAEPFPATLQGTEETADVDNCTISTTASSGYVTSALHGMTTHMTAPVTATITPTSDEREATTAELHQPKESYPTNGKITRVLDVLKKYYPVLIPCGIVLSVPFLVLGGLLMKRKKLKKYQPRKLKSLNKQEESEPMEATEAIESTSTERENGIFPL